MADALELVPRKAQHSHGRSVWRREGLVQRIENDQRWLEDIKHLIALREGP